MLSYDINIMHAFKNIIFYQKNQEVIKICSRKLKHTKCNLIFPNPIDIPFLRFSI